MPKTAGIIIIGDEILNGSVADTNSTFLCRRFRALGVKVQKISTVPDDVEILSKEIALFSKLYDIVITSGGVGPTHDDVTYESVAVAFNSSLILSKELKKCFDWYLCKGDEEGLRLVRIPHNAEVLVVEINESVDVNEPLKKNFPIVKTFNVYNFPGVPKFLKKTFIGLQDKHFVNNDIQFFFRVIYLNVYEISVVSVLKDVSHRYKEHVMIGSYPRTDDRYNYETKITLESTSLEHCLNAEKELLMKLSPSILVHAPLTLPDFEFMYRLSTLNCELSERIRDSFQVIENCFSKYAVPEKTFIGFNGGKDCTVVLNLLYCYYLHKEIRTPLTLVYFKDEHSFPELDKFIDFIKDNYNAELLVKPTPMKKSLKNYLEEQRKMKKSACFLGLRSIDPKSENLKPMQETDGDWPRIMRVFPILNWSYKDVWNFIRCTNIPYCSLYDQGYTSLGNVNNTSPNSELKLIDQNGSVYFRPAFLLDEEKSEREGR